MKRLYEMHGEGHSARAIARELGLARNTVLKYLRSPDAMRPKPRRRRGLMLDPYAQHIDRRLAEGLENCVVLLRELRALGYEGAYSTLTEYLRPRAARAVSPRRRCGSRQRRESRLKWTGAAWGTWAPTGRSTGSGCS